VRALEGGNAAWLAAGHALTAADAKMADEAVDAWLKPYERPSDKAAAMRDYLSWEVDLPARIARDGSANFKPPVEYAVKRSRLTLGSVRT
jgi:hypothetical protein